MTVKLCGAGMGLLGFMLSLIIGLYVDNPFTTVVSRALLVLVLFFFLGCVLAGLGQQVVRENFEIEAENIRSKSEDDSEPEQPAADEDADVQEVTGPISPGTQTAT